MYNIEKIANFAKESRLMDLFIDNPFDTTVRLVFWGGALILALAGSGSVLSKADINGSNLNKIKTSFDSSVIRAIK